MKEEMVSCEECGLVLRNKEALWVHNKIRHTEEEKPFKCGVCEKPFATKSNLGSHLRAVHKIKNSVKSRKEELYPDR